MERAIRNGDTVHVGFGTGIDGHVARVIRVNDLAATALVETIKTRTRKDVHISKLTLTEGSNMNLPYGHHIETDAESISWKRLVREDKVVEAIRDFRMSHSCGLKEAKDVIEAYRDKWRISFRSKPRIVNLPNKGQLIITQLPSGMFEVQESRTVGTFNEHELFQVIANVSAGV